MNLLNNTNAEKAFLKLLTTQQLNAVLGESYAGPLLVHAHDSHDKPVAHDSHDKPVAHFCCMVQHDEAGFELCSVYAKFDHGKLCVDYGGNGYDTRRG